MNNIDILLKEIDVHQANLVKKKECLELLKGKLAGVEFPLNLSCYGNTVDIDYPGRTEVVTLITHFKAGKWSKEASSSEGKIDYRNDKLLPMPIRIYGAEPPPSCKIVEEDELIPAQPAYVVKRKKVVCKEHLLTPVV